MRSSFLDQIYDKRPPILQYKKAEMLRRVVAHAVNNVPFYRNLIRDSISTETSAQVVDNLAAIPVLERSTIRDNLASMTTSVWPVAGPFWNTSGGSTGVPVRILQDKTYLTASRFITYQQKKMTGFRWGMQWMKLWGNEREVLSGRRAPQEIIGNYVKRLKVFNTFQMTDLQKIESLKKIQCGSPKLIVAYVQSMYDLAKFAKLTGVRDFNIGAIIVSAGTLYPFMRKEIEQVFCAPVFNRYGSREVGNIALSYPKETCLMISEGVWVEVVDTAGNPQPCGVEGDIVVTSLINYAMPLIRYRIGDRGVLGNRMNANGLFEIVLEEVKGRSVDIFKSSLGVSIDGEYFTHLMYFRDWAEKFQFIQENVNKIIVRVKLNRQPPEKDLLEIERKIWVVMGNRCEIQFDFVEDIIDPPSGKFRFTISKINS